MKTVTMDAFYAMGHEARTTNAREMSGQGVIGKMWSTGVPGASAIVAVYSEYASDKDGEYSYLLGSKVGESEKMPRDLVRRKVEQGRYVQLSAKNEGKAPVVVGLWQQVWALEGEGKIKRAYRTDFELYGEAGVELYVGVKD
jgi:predicted transcriptional regulator YdeE